MKSLCNALLGKSETNSEEISDFDIQRVLEAQAEEELQRESIAELDRYRRMDEWTSSFQNLYTRAALYCQVQLMKANVVELDLMQILPYTRAGNYDLLRLDAFECLVLDLDRCRTPEIVKWLIYSMSSDGSPWIRWRLHTLFGRALAPIAFFGFGAPTDHPPPPPGGGSDLIIEQEGSTEVRQVDLARRQTVTGAIDALKTEMAGNYTLRTCLWAACNAPDIGVLEISDFVDLCRILYDPVTSSLVRLKYPRYWRVQHLGNVGTPPPPFPQGDFPRLLHISLVFLLLYTSSRVHTNSFYRASCTFSSRTAIEYRLNHYHHLQSARGTINNSLGQGLLSNSRRRRV